MDMNHIIVNVIWFRHEKNKKKLDVDIPWGCLSFTLQLDTIFEPQLFNLLFIRQRIYFLIEKILSFFWGWSSVNCAHIQLIQSLITVFAVRTDDDCHSHSYVPKQIEFEILNFDYETSELHDNHLFLYIVSLELECSFAQFYSTQYIFNCS